METIKTIKTTKTIEITETTEIYRDTISRVEIIDIDKPLKHYPINDYTYDKICLIGECEYVYTVDDISTALCCCNKDFRMIRRSKRFNAFDLYFLLKGAVIDIQYTNIHSDDYMYRKSVSSIVNITLSEKAIKMIHNMRNHYISIELGY